MLYQFYVSVAFKERKPQQFVKRVVWSWSPPNSIANTKLEGTKGYFVKIGKYVVRFHFFVKVLTFTRNWIIVFVSSTVLHFTRMTKTHRNRRTLSCWSWLKTRQDKTFIIIILQVQCVWQASEGKCKGGLNQGWIAVPFSVFLSLSLSPSVLAYMNRTSPLPVSPLSLVRACESKT